MSSEYPMVILCNPLSLDGWITQVGVIGQKNSHIQEAGHPLHALATHVADEELLQDLRLIHLLL